VKLSLNTATVRKQWSLAQIIDGCARHQITGISPWRDQVAQMVTRVAGGKRLPAEVVHHIVTQTDGVPLFIEELTKTVLESGLLREMDGDYELTGSLSAVAIPTTLQDSLMARLDRLGTAKGMAQWGATLGRQFSYALLQAVSQREEATLQRDLGRLIEAELLYQRGVLPQATYLFKHALIQEAAYQSLLRSTRQYYHQRAARVLTEQFAETVETHPELIAHHYTEAACNEQAVPYWQLAGQRAIQRSAHLEAVAHLTQGLDVLMIIPDTPARAQQELALRLTLGTSLSVTKGWPAPEVGKAYSRAQHLCQQVGETAHLFPVLWGLWHFHAVRGEPQTGLSQRVCLELAEYLNSERINERTDDDKTLVLASRRVADTVSSDAQESAE
jgi:predicted ATPase